MHITFAVNDLCLLDAGTRRIGQGVVGVVGGVNGDEPYRERCPARREIVDDMEIQAGDGAVARGQVRNTLADMRHALDLHMTRNAGALVGIGEVFKIFCPRAGVGYIHECQRGRVVIQQQFKRTHRQLILQKHADADVVVRKSAGRVGGQREDIHRHDVEHHAAGIGQTLGVGGDEIDLEQAGIDHGGGPGKFTRELAVESGPRRKSPAGPGERFEVRLESVHGQTQAFTGVDDSAVGHRHARCLVFV